MALRCHLETVLQDLCYAARDLRRNRHFALAALLALTLGIGAGTAVFSAVDRILFRGLPYRQGERLVSFGMTAPIAPQEFLLGYDYWDWRDAQTPFESVGAWGAGLADCDLNDTRPQRLRCARADSSLLATLGTEMVAGQTFSRQEERPGAPKVALISNALWRSRFGADPAAIGRSIMLDGRAVTVAGVLPAQFELPNLDRPDVVLPQVLDDAEQHARRSAVLVYAVGRLRPGVTPEQASEALRPLFARSLEAVPPSFRKDVKLLVQSLRDRQIRDVRLASWVLLGAVAPLLLLMCANIANLLLARGAARQRELAIRSALGASRGRLVRQTLTESALLALTGGSAGCALAFGMARVFSAMAPDGIPRLREASVDGRVLLFAIAVSLFCGMLFGLIPALQRSGARSAVGGFRLRQGLVAGQIAISLVLLTGAGLLLRSLWQIQNQPLGMRAEGAMTVSVSLGRASYADATRRLAFFGELEQRLRSVPGVQQVGLANSLPPANTLAGSMLYAAIDVRGRPRFTDGTGGTVAWRLVTPDYFPALRIPILRGRPFVEDDRDPNRHVVILSDALARRMFPGEDPLGQEIRPGRSGPWLTVVGVAANVKNHGLTERDDPEYYVPWKRSVENAPYSATAILRGAIAPGPLAAWARAQVAGIDPTVPAVTETMDQQVGRLAERPRFNALLLGIFAAVGLLLAMIGLYGVISFLVAQRSGEIGVRMALGATRGSITRLVLGQAAKWTVGGAIAGVAGSLFAARVLEHMLFHVRATDPWTLAAAVAVLLAVALAAVWAPSRRAALIDPARALRRE